MVTRDQEREIRYLVQWMGWMAARPTLQRAMRRAAGPIIGAAMSDPGENVPLGRSGLEVERVVRALDLAHGSVLIAELRQLRSDLEAGLLPSQMWRSAKARGVRR